MPDNRDEWLKMMIETGQLPDSNGYYRYNPGDQTEFTDKRPKKVSDSE